MIHILICDDDLIFAQDLRAHITLCCQQRQIEISTRICTSGDELRQAIADTPPALIFLDLMLRNEEGYDIARELRTDGSDAEIVFVTSYSERMPEAFAYRPIGFITKPVVQTEVMAAINRFLMYQRTAQASYCINTRKLALQIPLKDICYFESSAHRVLVHRNSSEEAVSHIRSLDEVANELRGHHFIRCHKSYLVNAAFIAMVDKVAMQVVLANGRRLPISRSNYISALEQFVQYQMR